MKASKGQWVELSKDNAIVKAYKILRYYGRRDKLTQQAAIYERRDRLELSAAARKRPRLDEDDIAKLQQLLPPDESKILEPKILSLTGGPSPKKSKSILKTESTSPSSQCHTPKKRICFNSIAFLISLWDVPQASTMSDMEKTVMWYSDNDIDTFKTDAEEACKRIIGVSPAISEEKECVRGLEFCLDFDRQEKSRVDVRFLLEFQRLLKAKPQTADNKEWRIAAASEQLSAWAKEMAIITGYRDQLEIESIMKTPAPDARSSETGALDRSRVASCSSRISSDTGGLDRSRVTSCSSRNSSDAGGLDRSRLASCSSTSSSSQPPPAFLLRNA